MYAHSANRDGERQPLLEHLRNVASLARSYARPFGGGDLAWLAGLWHDVGKADPAWQRYLIESESGKRARGTGPDHKYAGAALAIEARQDLVAFLVHAHHGGLQHRFRDFQPWLTANAPQPGPREAINRIRPALARIDRPAPSAVPPESATSSPSAGEMFLRFLYSALVDADSLDTERHFLGGANRRPVTPAIPTVLWQRFESFLARQRPTPDSVVNRVRAEVFEACVASAQSPPGVFRLTVPTGGGKTRSAMAFALRHAIAHGFRRVIVAVPFTSITQQTAAVYRAIFESGWEESGPVVLEHHSAASELADASDFTPEGTWAQLAAENWDAPIVVTTTVQLFESLFSNRRGKTRKLHNLANSVIILDEAQALPSHLLAPILDGLHQLASQYGATVVLSTATQPAFDVIPQFAAVPARELVPDHERHFEALRRVRFDWRTASQHDWDEVSGWIRAEPRSLTILNTKRHAVELLDVLAGHDVLYLSTSLCGAHRAEVLEDIRARLREGRSCRVVSTQVVEAGIDLDFPVVFRAQGPLDSVIQAAGRCNREGLLPGPGRVVVFEPPDDAMPPGSYRTGADLARLIANVPDFDATDPGAVRRYSSLLLGGSIDPDREHIQALRADFDFPEVARRFRMIDDDAYDVVVEYPAASASEIASLMTRLRERDPDVRAIVRRLRPHTASLRRRQAEQLIRAGLISELLPGLGQWHGRYDAIRGLVSADPELVL